MFPNKKGKFRIGFREPGERPGGFYIESNPSKPTVTCAPQLTAIFENIQIIFNLLVYFSKMNRQATDRIGKSFREPPNIQSEDWPRARVVLKKIARLNRVARRRRDQHSAGRTRPGAAEPAVVGRTEFPWR
jgi:hypothetical protein